MATYLIDYENTGVKGLVGIEQLKEDDLIIIFMGRKQEQYHLTSM